AVAGGDPAAHRVLQAKLCTNVEIAKPRADRTQLVLDHLADARSFLHHEHRLGAQVVERDRLAREPMTGRTREHDLVAKERLEDDASVAPCGADDAELELAVGYLVDDRLRIRHGEPNAHLRMLLAELAQDERDDGAAGAGGSAELERSGQ